MAKLSELEVFSERLDRYGADLARWPEDESGEAERLLARSPEARALRDGARRLEALIARAAHAEAPNGFAFRVVGQVAARRSRGWSWSWFPGAPGVGLAGVTFCVAALAIGVAIGSVAAPPTTSGFTDLGAGLEVSLLDGDL
jgi:hypothetical protein